MKRALLFAVMVVAGSFVTTSQAQTLQVRSLFGGETTVGPEDDTYISAGFVPSEPMILRSWAFALTVSSPDLILDPLDGFQPAGLGFAGPETFRWTLNNPVLIHDFGSDDSPFVTFHFVVSPTAQPQDIFITAYQPLGSNWDWVGGPTLPTRPDFTQASWVVHVVPAPSAAAMMLLGAPLVLGRRRRAG